MLDSRHYFVERLLSAGLSNASVHLLIAGGVDTLAKFAFLDYTNYILWSPMPQIEKDILLPIWREAHATAVAEVELKMESNGDQLDLIHYESKEAYHRHLFELLTTPVTLSQVLTADRRVWTYMASQRPDTSPMATEMVGAVGSTDMKFKEVKAPCQSDMCTQKCTFVLLEGRALRRCGEDCTGLSGHPTRHRCTTHEHDDTQSKGAEAEFDRAFAAAFMAHDNFGAPELPFGGCDSPM